MLVDAIASLVNPEASQTYTRLLPGNHAPCLSGGPANVRAFCRAIRLVFYVQGWPAVVRAAFHHLLKCPSALFPLHFCPLSNRHRLSLSYQITLTRPLGTHTRKLDPTRKIDR